MLQNHVLKWALGPPPPLAQWGRGPMGAWALGLHYLRGNALLLFDRKNEKYMRGSGVLMNALLGPRALHTLESQGVYFWEKWHLEFT